MTAAHQITPGTVFNPQNTESPFAPIPNWILKRSELSPGAKLTYARLIQYSGKNGQCFPKIKTLADEIGYSESQVIRFIRELESFNLIQSKRRGLGKSNTYQFLTHIWMYDGPTPKPPTNSVETQHNPPESDDSSGTATDDSSGTATDDSSGTATDDSSLIDNSNQKKQTTAGVVSLDDCKKQKAFDAVPDKYRTAAVKKITNASVDKHGFDYTLNAVRYTNAHSKTSYGGYLARTIKNDYAADWTPPEIIEQRSQAETAKQDRADQEALTRKVKADEHRAELAQQWIDLPADDRQTTRAAYLEQCKPFELKRARLLADDRLAGTIGFRRFLETRDQIQPSK